MFGMLMVVVNQINSSLTRLLSDDLLVHFEVKYYKDMREQDQPKPIYESIVRNLMPNSLNSRRLSTVA